MERRCPMANGKACIGKECIFSMGTEIPCMFIESYLHSLQSSVRISPYMLAHVSQTVASGALHVDMAVGIVEILHKDLLASLRLLRYLEDNPLYPKAKQRKIRAMRLKLKQEMTEFGE